ncbi:MAG: LysM peptidoglycan-binding domain-containing protein [Lentisphaeria bacterium]|nr:LysM peptidoglycan-binding domain-containing protein [Lentisphaeria bacterium]
MKTTLWLPGCAAAAALLTAGCGPDLAQGGYGAEEQQWQKEISENYSGYRPPRIAPPAIVDHAAPEALEKQRQQGETAPGADSVSEVPAPAEDKDQAVQTVDSAADKTASDAGAKKADDKKADDKKADGKKADDKKADDKKADGKDAAAAGADCEIYVVKSGDTPGSIARKFYGKASHYDLILKANPRIRDPRQIPIGTKLRIPKL